MTSRRLAFGLLLWVYLLLSSPGPLLLAQGAVDPQSLVGEWVGKWIAGTTSGGPGPRGGTQGPYSLVISRVEGDRVFARIETQGFSGPALGTLSGNRLTFAGERFRVELMVNGSEMRGTRQGGGVPGHALQLVRR